MSLDVSLYKMNIVYSFEDKERYSRAISTSYEILEKSIL